MRTVGTGTVLGETTGEAATVASAVRIQTCARHLPAAIAIVIMTAITVIMINVVADTEETTVTTSTTTSAIISALLRAISISV